MDKVTQIRSFNRTYTQVLGLLNNHILESDWSLSESRVLYELVHRGDSTAKTIGASLNMDKGYLSRVLKKLKKLGLIDQKPSLSDKRYNNIVLTQTGRSAFDRINKASENQIKNLLTSLNPYEEKRLVAALGMAKQIFEKKQADLSLKNIIIRNHLESGDIGFVLQAHGELYHTEHQFGVIFDKYVAEGLVEFLNQKAQNKSMVWVCEHNYNRIGFLLLMDRGESAQLRYFFIYPEYRGIGLGKKLMQLFMDALIEKGFNSCYLWTASGLPEATGLYEKFGFKLVEEVPSTAFGKELLELKYNWERKKINGYGK